MRKLIISSVIIFLALSCNTVRHISAASIGLKNLDDYTAKQNIDLPYAFNYIVLTNQADFDAAFGIAKAGNINITYPDFKGQTVLACVAQPTASDINIHFDKAEVAGKDLNVYCSVTDNRKTLAQTTTPAVLATVPKVLDIKRIIFYTNGEKVMIRAVNFKNENSFVNIGKAEIMHSALHKPAAV